METDICAAKMRVMFNFLINYKRDVCMVHICLLWYGILQYYDECVKHGIRACS